jgi:hypothetical protein
MTLAPDFSPAILPAVPVDPEPEEWERLLTLDDEDFDDELTDDFYRTTSYRSPFLHPSVIERTWTHLNHALIRVDGQIRARAEDPNVTAEQYRRTVNYRAMVIRVLLMVEGHPNWPVGGSRSKRSEGQHWRLVAHRLAEVIEGGPDDDALDAQVAVEQMTVRAWLERRRIKDPSRVPAKELAA